MTFHYDPTWPTLAGYACASHVGHMVTVNGATGRLFRIEHDEAYQTVRLLLTTKGDTIAPLHVAPDTVIELAPASTPRVRGPRRREDR